jgi:uncharacterized protein YjcR
MGAPMGNKNAAGSRGGATNRMKKAVQRARRKVIMNKFKTRTRKKGKIYEYKEPSYLRK